MQVQRAVPNSPLVGIVPIAARRVTPPALETSPLELAPVRLHVRREPPLALSADRRGKLLTLLSMFAMLPGGASARGHTVARDLAQELVTAGAKRFIVMGAGASDVLREITCGAAQQIKAGIVIRYEDAHYINGARAQDRSGYDDCAAVHTRAVAFDQTGMHEAPLFWTLEAPVVAWLQAPNAVCRPGDTRFRLECPDGMMVPPGPANAFLRGSPEIYTETLDWYSKANARGLATVLVVPDSHWAGDGQVMVNPAVAAEAKTRSANRHVCAAVTELVVNVAFRRMLAGMQPLLHAWQRRALWGMMEAVDIFLQQWVSPRVLGEEITAPRPDFEAFTRHFAAQGHVVHRLPASGEVQGMTIIAPAQFASVLSKGTCASANADADLMNT